MKNLLNKYYCLIVFVLLSTQSNAQSKFTAGLPEILSDSFYSIGINPLIVAKCKPGLADLRIHDNNGKIVPYYIQPQQTVFKESSFVELPILNSARGADKQTYFTIQNTSDKIVNELILQIKNTDAGRLVTISGSDDNDKFYVITENIYLQNVTGEEGAGMQSISFPPSRYKYFRVTILGKDVLPVNITRAGFNIDNNVVGKYEKIPKPFIRQVDSSDKNSYITIGLSEKFQSDKLDLLIKGAKYYKRNIEIRDGKDKNGESYYFTISPDNISSLLVHFKTNLLLLVIHNDDNPPLQITGVDLWQLSTSVVAYLEKGKKYSLLFGDNNATAPGYDISNFAESVSGRSVAILPNKIETVAITGLQPASEQNFSQPMLWVIIVAVLLVLLFVTYQLTKQVKERK